MSAKTVLLWSLAAILGLSTFMTLGPETAPVASLATGLGPTVETTPL